MTSKTSLLRGEHKLCQYILPFSVGSHHIMEEPWVTLALCITEENVNIRLTWHVHTKRSACAVEMVWAVIKHPSLGLFVNIVATV